MNARIKYFLLLCLGICLSSVSLQAQKGLISGVITDADDGSTLPGAAIFIKGVPTSGTITDIDGSFTLNNVNVGDQVIVVSFLGYADQEIPVQVIEGQTAEVEVKMTFGAITSEEVVVTAQLLGQAKAINQQLNSESIANIVSADRIQELPDVNAAEAVARLPGVSINRSGGEGQKVVIRGLEPKFNAITVNGVRLPGNAGNDRSVDLSLISPELLDGIEVFKSPLPDMDAESVGGTVNLRLRKAPKEAALLVRGLGGYNNLNSEFADYKGVIQLSKRFFENKLGVVAQANLERFNRGGDILSYNWSQGGTDPMTGVTEILGNFSRLEDRKEIRKRRNGSLSLDYSMGNTDLSLFTLYSNTTRDRFININEYRPSEPEIRYIGRGIDVDSDLLIATLAAEHKLPKLTIDWSASASRTETDVPYDFNMQLFDNNNPLDPELNRTGHPRNFRAGFTPDFANSRLRSVEHDNTNTLEDNLNFALNFQVPLSLSDKIGGYLKFGGRYRTVDRKREVLSSGEPFYYLGGEVTSDAANQYEGDLIFTQVNNQLIALQNFVVEGSSVDFENENGEQIDFDAVLDPGLVRDWYNQQQSILKINRNTRVDNFEVSETVSAGYVMLKLNIGKQWTFIPGFRYEYSDNSYSSGISNIANDFTGLEGSFTPTESTQEYGEFLPHFHIKYQPLNWLDVRASYAATLARPDYAFITPRARINDNSLVITAGNQNLEHMRSDNYDLTLTAYKGGWGLFTVGGFYKDINNVFVPQSIQLVDEELAAERGFPDRVGYLLNSYTNFPDSKVYGFELDLQTNLSFLPGPLSGIVINANYARLFSETTAFFLTSETAFVGFPPRPVTTFTSNQREVTMPSQVPHILNLSIGYDYKKFSARISGIFQGTKASSYSQNKDFDRFDKSFWRWDASIKQRVGNHLSFFLNVNNISNQQDISFIRNEDFLSRIETYGLTGTIGAQYKL